MRNRASAWDTHGVAAPDFGRARGVPVHLPPINDVPGVALCVEIAGVPDSAMLSAGRVLPSGLWLLEREDLAGLRLLPTDDAADPRRVGPASLEVTFVATDRATGRAGSMTTALDIPGGWAAAGDGTAGGVRYSLADDAGGRFEIDPVSGLVAVADESLLDPAVEPRQRIAVRMAYADGQVCLRHYEIELLGDAREFAVTELGDRNDARRSTRHYARPGAVVGTVSVPIDVDVMDILRFRLLDDADGRFAIDPWSGVVTVADAVLLDSEPDAGPDARYAITVEVVSADGWMSVQEFTIAPGKTDGSFSVTTGAGEDEAAGAVPWLAATHFLSRSAGYARPTSTKDRRATTRAPSAA